MWLTAGCGEEALGWLEKNEIDILVLDMIMNPGLDGCEAYRRMLVLKPELKAIIVSGFTESDRIASERRSGWGPLPM